MVFAVTPFDRCSLAARVKFEGVEAILDCRSSPNNAIAPDGQQICFECGQDTSNLLPGKVRQAASGTTGKGFAVSA